MKGATRREVFARGVAALREAGIDTPALDAAVLLGYVTSQPPEAVLMDRGASVTASEAALYSALVRKRCERTAVSRLVGVREFYSRTFRVTDDVLDPRPETEVLVEHALRCLKGLRKPPAVLDVGTGSGAIAVTVAAEIPSARVTATDISMAALAVARNNAARQGVEERIRFVQADLLEPFRFGGRFDVILSNPPYVSWAQFENLPQEVRGGDPGTALVSGPEGLEFYAPLAAASRNLLVPGGSLMVEVGDGQDAAVAAILKGAGFRDVRVVKDLAGRGRVVAGSSENA